VLQVKAEAAEKRLRAPHTAGHEVTTRTGDRRRTLYTDACMDGWMESIDAMVRACVHACMHIYGSWDIVHRCQRRLGTYAAAKEDSALAAGRKGPSLFVYVPVVVGL
jgi:hypothetical protein